MPGRRLFSSALPSVQHLELNVTENVATLTFNRPKLHNAFNEEVIEEVTRSVNFFNEQDDVHALVITGNGKSFSAGADLNWMKKMAQYSHEENVQDSQGLFGMFNAIQECSKPVIGRVNGSCFGGGVGLVSVCDIAFGMRKALFGFTEVKLGLVPAVISPFVTQKIGFANASRYFLTGESFDGERAVRMNLMQDVCDTEEQLDALVAGVLDAFKLTQPGAVKRCKAMLKTVAAAPNPSSVRDYVVGQIADARVSEEAQTQLSKFLESRKK